MEHAEKRAKQLVDGHDVESGKVSKIETFRNLN